MSPRGVSDPLVRDSPTIRADDTVETAVRCLLDSDLPALPVVEGDGRSCGIFGEREFFRALNPRSRSEAPAGATRFAST